MEYNCLFSLHVPYCCCPLPPLLAGPALHAAVHQDGRLPRELRLLQPVQVGVRVAAALLVSCACSAHDVLLHAAGRTPPLGICFLKLRCLRCSHG